MPLIIKIEPADEVVRAYIAKHPFEFCRPCAISIKSEPTVRSKNKPFAELNILRVKDETVEDPDVSALRAVTQMRDNESTKQLSSLTGERCSFSLILRTTTTDATTTYGLTGEMGSLSLAQNSTTATVPSAKAETATSPARLAPPSYEEGVRFEVASGKWTSFRWNDTSCPETINFNLIPNNGHHSHNDETTTENLLELFQSAYASRSLTITKMLNDPFLKNNISAIHHFQMAHAVYCSNFIERVGPSKSITTNLALMVFNGQKVLDIPTEYEEKECLSILSLEEKEKGLTMKDVVISRREVIQHSKALMYILNVMINLDCPLTE